MVHEKMKKKKESFYDKNSTLVGFILILLAVTPFFLHITGIYTFYEGKEFVITSSDGEIIEMNWENICLDIGNAKCFSPDYDGIEFLDENCQCLEKECSIHYNYSQRAIFSDNVSNTWNGPIEFREDGSVIFYKPGAQVVEECSSCQRYQCQDYTVEISK